MKKSYSDVFYGILLDECQGQCHHVTRCYPECRDIDCGFYVALKALTAHMAPGREE